MSGPVVRMYIAFLVCKGIYHASIKIEVIEPETSAKAAQNQALVSLPEDAGFSVF